MAFSLGTGLSGFMQGAQQGAQGVSQLLLLRQALQQAKQQQAAQALVGEVLAAGGIPGMGGGGGTFGLPGMGTPQPPAPGQSSAPPPQAMTPGQPENPYAPALQPAVPPQPTVQPETPLGQEIAAAPPSGPAIPLDTPSPPAGGPAGGAAAAPPASLSAGGGGGAPTLTGDPLQVAQAMLQHVDPQQIAARIKAVRPDADPAAIAMATESIYKMAQGGDKMQAVGLAATLKYLGLGQQIQSREKIAEENIAGRAANVATQQAGATERTGITQQGANERAAAARQASAEKTKTIQDRIDARFNQSIQTRQMSMAQKAQAAKIATSYKNIMTQIAAIKAQSDMGVSTPQQKQQLQALQEQAVRLYGQLTQMGVTVDTPNTLLQGQVGGPVPTVEAPVNPAQ